jgi:hypothetical protein
MELNTEHRTALLSELAKAKKDLIIQKQGKENHISHDLSNWFDITIFLATERINLIEKSIIDNEIDY